MYASFHLYTRWIPYVTGAQGCFECSLTWAEETFQLLHCQEQLKSFTIENQRLESNLWNTVTKAKLGIDPLLSLRPKHPSLPKENKTQNPWGKSWSASDHVLHVHAAWLTKHFFHYLVVNLFFGNDIEKNTERSVVDILFIIYKMYVLDEKKNKRKMCFVWQIFFIHQISWKKMNLMTPC